VFPAKMQGRTLASSAMRGRDGVIGGESRDEVSGSFPDADCGAPTSHAARASGKACSRINGDSTQSLWVTSGPR